MGEQVEEVVREDTEIVDVAGGDKRVSAIWVCFDGTDWPSL